MNPDRDTEKRRGVRPYSLRESNIAQRKLDSYAAACPDFLGIWEEAMAPILRDPTAAVSESKRKPPVLELDNFKIIGLPTVYITYNVDRRARIVDLLSVATYDRPLRSS